MIESDGPWKKVEVLLSSWSWSSLLWRPAFAVVVSVREEEDDEARVSGAEAALVKREEEGESEEVDGDEKRVPEEGERRAD